MGDGTQAIEAGNQSMRNKLPVYRQITIEEGE
jgi:hypothetical protein